MDLSAVWNKILTRLHLDSEEVITVLLQLPRRSILVVEGLLHLFEALEQMPRE